MMAQEGVDEGRVERNPVGIGTSATFRMPDGGCEEGTACHVGGEVIFIESKREISLGTEVTIRLTRPNGGVGDWGVVEGAVVRGLPAGCTTNLSDSRTEMNRITRKAGGA